LFSFISPKKIDLTIRKNSFEINSNDVIKINHLSVAKNEIIEFSISKNTFFEGFLAVNKPLISIVIQTKTADGELFYPNQGTLDLIF
jgi:hypothetical protein